MDRRELVEKILDEKIRTFLEADGFNLEIKKMDGESIEFDLVSTRGDTCRDCLVPPDTLKDIISMELTEKGLENITSLIINDLVD